MSYFISKEFDYIHNVVYRGGGGASGAVSFPEYMEDAHEDWIGTTPVTTPVSSLINAGLANNPLEGIEYKDPDVKEGALENKFDAWETFALTADTAIDYENAVIKAAEEVDTEGVLKEIDVTDLVDAARAGSFETVQATVLGALEAIDDGRVYEAVQTFVNARRIDRSNLRARYQAQMSNISTERSSAYAIGLALLEAEFERETTEFQSNLSTEMYRQGLQAYASAFASEVQARVQSATIEKQSRDQILSQGIQLQLSYLQFIHQLRQEVVRMLGEVNRLNFVMDSEYVGNTADLNWKYSSWDMNVYQGAVNILGGIGGGTYVPEGPTKAGSAIGGALSGAATGAAIGGPVGAGVGAVVGGLAGLF